MKKFILRVGFIILMGMVFSSCVFFTTNINDKPSTTEKVKNLKIESLGIADGVSSSFHLLWFIPVTEKANFDLAIKDAIESKGGDNLTKIKYKKKREIWILGIVTIYKVRGEVTRNLEE